MDYRRAIRGSYNSSFRYPLLYITVIARDFLQKGVDRELRNEVKRSVKVVRGEKSAMSSSGLSSIFALTWRLPESRSTIATLFVSLAGLRPSALAHNALLCYNGRCSWVVPKMKILC